MSLNTNALSLWADELSSGLAKETILNADTLLRNDLVTKKFGIIGSSTKLNTLKATPLGIAAGNCATIVNSGSTIFGQNTMSHCEFEFPQSICYDLLKDYWTDWENERRFNPNESGGRWEDTMLEVILNANMLEMDKMIWQSDNSVSKYAAVTGNLNLCIGAFGVLYQNSGSTAEVIAKSALTSTNVLAVINNHVMLNIPEAIKNNCNLYLSPQDFETYVGAIVTEYKYNLNLIDVSQINELRHPTSIGLVVKKVNGMTGIASGSMIATPQSNIVVGIADEKDLSLDAWYEKKDRSLWVNFKQKMGVGFNFYELAVLVK